MYYSKMLISCYRQISSHYFSWHRTDLHMLHFLNVKSCCPLVTIMQTSFGSLLWHIYKCTEEEDNHYKKNDKTGPIHFPSENYENLTSYSETFLPFATMSMPPLCRRSPLKFPWIPSALAFKTGWKNMNQKSHLKVFSTFWKWAIIYLTPWI